VIRAALLSCLALVSTSSVWRLPLDRV
jgi:hypothetical protein